MTNFPMYGIYYGPYFFINQNKHIDNDLCCNSKEYPSEHICTYSKPWYILNDLLVIIGDIHCK